MIGQKQSLHGGSLVRLTLMLKIEICCRSLSRGLCMALSVCTRYLVMPWNHQGHLSAHIQMRLQSLAVRSWNNFQSAARGSDCCDSNLVLYLYLLFSIKALNFCLIQLILGIDLKYASLTHKSQHQVGVIAVVTALL